MSPLKIQFGDIATRIARAFRVAGRIPVDLDEMMVPVAIMENLATDPFRTEPITWRGSINDPAPPAGSWAVSGVRCVDGVVLVDEVACFTSATGPMLLLNRRATQGFNTVPNLVSLNQKWTGPAAAFPKPAARLIEAVNVGSPAVAPAFEIAINPFGGHILGVGAAIPFPVVLFPGDELLVTSIGAASSLSGWITGREYTLLDL